MSENKQKISYSGKNLILTWSWTVICNASFHINAKQNLMSENKQGIEVCHPINFMANYQIARARWR